MTLGSQMPELDRGLFCPLYILGNQNTQYILRLRYICKSFILFKKENAKQVQYH